jgi:transcriptional/translational regulatory protein YebC/TACO1
MNTNNYNCGISDVHNIIAIQMKGNMPSNKKELKCFRSFKNFDQEKFTEDLNKIYFDKLTDHDDVSKIYSDFEEEII